MSALLTHTWSHVERYLRSWRQEPWPLLPLGQTPLRYQIAVVVVLVVQVATVAAFWALGWAGIGITDAALLAGALLIALPQHFVVFRSHDTLTAGNELTIPLALLIAGHPGAAIVCLTAGLLLGAAHKPLPAYAVVANVVHGIFVLVLAAAIFPAVAGQSEPLGLRWCLAALCAFGVVHVATLFALNLPTTLAGYSTARECWTNWLRGGVSSMASMMPLVMLVGGVLTGGQHWHVLFLAVPFVLALDMYAMVDDLVAAQGEARRDPLTGLFNRRAFTAILELRSEGRDDSGNLDWVLYCDLDNFKRLNDTAGHEAGDRALVSLAGVLHDQVRTVDVCARIGGEEFVVLLQQLSRGDAADVAERVRAAVERELGELAVTASIGLHGVTPGEDAAEAMRRADVAMYAAKTSGKNRVVVTCDDDSVPASLAA